MLRRHRGKDDDGGNASKDNQEQPQVLRVWRKPVGEENQQRAEEEDNEVCDINVPCFGGVCGIVYGVELYSSVSGYLDE